MTPRGRGQDADRIRVGSPVLREGRPAQMETTTRVRDRQRTPAAPEQGRGNGPFRADRRPARAASTGAPPGRGPGRGGIVPPEGRRLRAVTEATVPRPTGWQPAARPSAARPEAGRAAAGPTQAPRTSRERPTPARASSRAAYPASTAHLAGTATLPRMPFVLLVLALLGGGLICLLVINTTLGATSFRISQLQGTNASLATQEETLQQQIAAERSPAQIAKLACALGMRAQTNVNILDLGTHRFYRLPGQAGGTGVASTVVASTGVASTGVASTPVATGAGSIGCTGTSSTGTSSTGSPGTSRAGKSSTHGSGAGTGTGRRGRRRAGGTAGAGKSPVQTGTAKTAGSRHRSGSGQ